MTLETLPAELTVCKLRDLSALPTDTELCFFARTDEELSLVCPTADVPADALERSDGWRAFRVRGTLDFSLVGILARLSGALAEAGIGLFAVSTFNTDYILVRSGDLPRALAVLARAGYDIAR